MKLKLDLHPIFNDSRRIEESLQAIIEEAVTKRATEVEIIPGKGSGALKKTVIRFLDRPEVKSRYHRLEKDSDNWGRLFIHFRHPAPDAGSKVSPVAAGPAVSTACACCGDQVTVPAPEAELVEPLNATCPWCGSPNRLSFRRDRRGVLHARAELDYSDV